MKDKKKSIFAGLRKGFCDSGVKKHDEASLADLLFKHDEDKIVPFHMPGHKRADFPYLNGAQKIVKEQVFKPFYDGVRCV